jgi:long-subunit acyl-CoA synthetase (AMP-forming)
MSRMENNLCFALVQDGYLNTGDLGRINPGTGHLIITGRLMLPQP